MNEVRCVVFVFSIYVSDSISHTRYIIDLLAAPPP
jgi:hypothetical protein